jgi:phage-related protein
MKYLKRYESFMNQAFNDVNINIDKSLSIVEKQVLNDFSVSFWDLSLNSSVFTTEEKTFIKENLMTNKVDLVNEGWLGDTLGNVWDKAKEVGGKIYDKVKSKITIIKDNIKNLVSGIADFIKSLFKSLGNTIATKSKAVYAAVKPKFESTVKMTFAKKKPDPKVLKNEIDQLKVTVEHLKNSIAAGLLTGSIDAADDAVITDAEGQVGELENELKAESQNHDILSAFYITEAEETKEDAPVEYKVGDKVIYKSKEGKEIEKEIIKIEGDNFFFKDKEGNEFSKAKTDIVGKAKSLGAKVWGGFTKWFLDMEQATPPVKGKAVWWLKLILKIVGLVLSPVVKALEIAVKFITSNILKAVSAAAKYLKGPGVFEFIVLGGIVAGLPALVTEFSLLGHIVPEPFKEIFEVIAEFLAEVTGIESLLLIIGGFCAAMTLLQLCLEFKHLFGDHSAHGDEKAPATPGAKPEGGEAPGSPTPVPTT